ncbi:hypothetical protein TD95_003073 [Thielaviopsis punctulata]|uniref:Zn(2)-C6 fungal-type domain-containing protein n=1 Tax=Thielaviopsis punctulata TaxID=72032 RepID=A0A0F4ZDL6_9PEZI|nr:hypothetical protein TD95_003073 [Thielaviopsis punctulata]
MSYDYSSTQGGDVHHLLDIGLNPAAYDPQRQNYTITTAPSTSIPPQPTTSEFTAVTTAALIPHSHAQVQLGLLSPIHMMPPQRSWPIGLDMAPAVTSAGSSPTSVVDEQHLQQQQRAHYHHSQPNSQCSSPHSQHSPQHSSQHSPMSYNASMSPIPDWAMHQHQHSHPHAHSQNSSPIEQQHSPPLHNPQLPVTMPPADPGFINETALLGFSTIPTNFNATTMGILTPTTQAALASTLAMDNFSMPALEDNIHQWSGLDMEPWTDLGAQLQLSPISRISSVGSGSPNSAYLDVVSLSGSSTGIPGEGWSMVDWNTNLMVPHNQAIFNPSQTLQLHSPTESSPLGPPFVLDDFPITFSSPSSSDSLDGSPSSSHRNCYHDHSHPHNHNQGHAHMPPGHNEGHHMAHNHSHGHVHDLSPAAVVIPMPIKSSSPASSRSSPTQRSPGNGSGVVSNSPVSLSRRSSGPKRSPISKSKVDRASNGKKDGTPGEKKVGRRKGPLLPEQRKQASEIRKLRACLRCKFLKKTCDKGEPCAGCQPSHARLWQVPCTRIDIKDIGYFMKDWKADYARHVDTGVSVYNVKGFSQTETLMWITHGYGFALPVMVREVFVADDNCFQVDWVENSPPDVENNGYYVRTECLDIGAGGVSQAVVSEYLDKHVEERFQEFVDDYFDGTPFITEILKTAHRYYKKEQSPVIRKALKLVMAYNLTMHITMIENPAPEMDLEGTIDDEESKFYGRTVAPVMINFQIKCAMADMWRDLQKDVLEELSQLYSSVYSGERLKNWPTIFMLASILLAVWEEMQFDCHYRVPDPAAVNKFCSDMETTPVGVIVGLFHAISQKLPAFADWDTSKHGQILNNNPAVCEALTEVREHVIKHESYLRTRPDAKFDSNDFDSLSNKFLSKLVIKAN